MRILRARKALINLSDRISEAFNEIDECNQDLRGYGGQIVELAGLRPTGFFEIDELRADAWRWRGETGKNRFPHLRLYARPIFKGGRRGAIQDIDDIFNIRLISTTEWNRKKEFHAKPKPKEKPNAQT